MTRAKAGTTVRARTMSPATCRPSDHMRSVKMFAQMKIMGHPIIEVTNIQMRIFFSEPGASKAIMDMRLMGTHGMMVIQPTICNICFNKVNDTKLGDVKVLDCATA